MNERIALLRAEVEKRGMRWPDAEVENRAPEIAMTDSDSQLVNGSSTNRSTASAGNAPGEQGPRAESGRLTDAELMSRLQERLQEDTEQDDEGVHL